MSFSRQEREFDRFFNRLDRPVKESRPDRFLSLVQIAFRITFVFAYQQLYQL